MDHGFFERLSFLAVWRRGGSGMKIIITILAAIVIIDAVIVYACCVVAGRADEAAEKIWRDKHDDS